MGISSLLALLESGEERYLGETANTLNAESAFDARWALILLTHVIDRLRVEYTSQGKESLFNTLQPFLDPQNSKELPSYEEIASQLQSTLGGAKTLIHRFRKDIAKFCGRKSHGRSVIPQA